MGRDAFARLNLVMAGACAMAAYTGFRGEHLYVVAAGCLLIGWSGLNLNTKARATGEGEGHD